MDAGQRRMEEALVCAENKCVVHSWITSSMAVPFPSVSAEQHRTLPLWMLLNSLVTAYSKWRTSC